MASKLDKMLADLELSVAELNVDLTQTKKQKEAAYDQDQEILSPLEKLDDLLQDFGTFLREPKNELHPTPPSHIVAPPFERRSYEQKNEPSSEKYELTRHSYNDAEMIKQGMPKERRIIPLRVSQEPKIPIRIYVIDSRNFKTVNITATMTVEELVDLVKKKALLEEDNDWSLFEIFNDLGLERPLRDWEVMSKVIASWDPVTRNAIMLRKYNYRQYLTVKGITSSYPQMYGFLYVLDSKQKWQKRFVEMKGSGIYHSKDSKGTGEQLLCLLSSFDVYTLTKPAKKAPTKFTFVLKSSQPKQFFENSSEYAHFLCAEKLEKMKDWVLCFRSAINWKQAQEKPEILRPALDRGSLASQVTTVDNLVEDGNLRPLLSFNEASESSAGKLNIKSGPPTLLSQISTKQYGKIPRDSPSPVGSVIDIPQVDRKPKKEPSNGPLLTFSNVDLKGKHSVSQPTDSQSRLQRNPSLTGTLLDFETKKRCPSRKMNSRAPVKPLISFD